MPAHSRNMSTHSLGSLPSTQRLDLGESIPTPTPAMKYATLARVEHPLSAADSSDSQSDHNVKIGGKTPSPRKHSALLVKAETFSAGTPRSQENTGIIGRMAESETGTPLHRAPSTTLSRPPSPNLSFDERSYTGPTTLPAFGAISYASHKRDHDFHELFPNISEHESLVEDYACALQKDILVQGRMYITDQRICFYASIFAWVTTIFIPFSEIACIEKKTVLLINNALEITTEDGKKYFFASFMQRDIVHSLMIKLWKRDVELMGPTDGYGERCSESVTDLDAEADAEMDMHDDGDGEEPHLDEHDSSTMRRHASADLLGESPTGELARHPSAELLAGSTTATGKSATADLPPIGVSPPKRSDGSLSSMPGATTARKSGQLLHTPSVVSASTSSHATHGASGKKRHKVHHHHRARSPARPLRHTSDLGPLPNASSCECDDHEKYTINMEKTYDLRLHRVWKLLFGIGSEETVRRAVVDFRKNRDFRVETHWSLNGAAVAKDRDDSITSGAKRVLCWVCPLNSALGPKQTRNVHEEIIAHKDLNV